MLYSIDTGKYVEKLPHKKEFDRWMKNLSASDYQNVIDALNQKVDLSDINTSSWIPGNDWTGTVYEPLIMLVEITKMPPVCFWINFLTY